MSNAGGYGVLPCKHARLPPGARAKGEKTNKRAESRRGQRTQSGWLAARNQSASVRGGGGGGGRAKAAVAARATSAATRSSAVRTAASCARRACMAGEGARVGTWAEARAPPEEGGPGLLTNLEGVAGGGQGVGLLGRAAKGDGGGGVRGGEARRGGQHPALGEDARLPRAEDDAQRAALAREKRGRALVKEEARARVGARPRHSVGQPGRRGVLGPRTLHVRAYGAA